MNLQFNYQANESISKYKLLSTYGGPGSIVHTQYGSIIVTCIEEWGFLKKILELQQTAVDLEKNVKEYVLEHASLEINGRIGISNDIRLLHALRTRKGLSELQFLVLIPDISLRDYDNAVDRSTSEVQFTIPTSFMPKQFIDKTGIYRAYGDWFKMWQQVNNSTDRFGEQFFPPKKNWISMDEPGIHSLKKVNNIEFLKQDNLVLVCKNGHMCDFPWSRFLQWRVNRPHGIENGEIANLFQGQYCCGSDDRKSAQIIITTSSSNASGFEGKWLKCLTCSKTVSLQGLMNLKVTCPGHKPWEADTGKSNAYYGTPNGRTQLPPHEICDSATLSVALTTGNNLYFTRVLSSIYMPEELFESQISLEIKRLEKEKEKAKNDDDLGLAIEIQTKIKQLKLNNPSMRQEELMDLEQELKYRHQEFTALSERSAEEISIYPDYLSVKDVTQELDQDIKHYFHRILRIDNIKVSSAQLDFSRLIPVDPEFDTSILRSKNIFRSLPHQVIAYPIVENYGEGIFFAFNATEIDQFAQEHNPVIQEIVEKLKTLYNERDNFSATSIAYGLRSSSPLYLIHSFCHVIMRELEFRCGYPTASLSERLFVSTQDNYRMYGCMIYTAEGAEGSMGGLIAQTQKENLNHLIRSAINRATICNSDPLCWESTGQGLFDLNHAACFSCTLISETSCEYRNLYLDRKILVDDEYGFFKSIVTNSSMSKTVYR